MAKAILACHRSLPQRQLERLVRASAERLVPAGLGGPRLRQLSCAGLALAVVNPPQSMPAEGCSVCVGQMCGPRANWQTPGADAPDGTYAIFRVNADSVEVLTDCAGTRSVWYYHDEEWFIAANSQRAIISILGSFRLNPEAVTWMLSAGSLGPAGSWDERVRRMPADARLRFDRATWELQESSAPAVFNPARYRDEEAATAEVRRVLEDACWGFDVPEHEWRIALSGGYDSRMLLAFLKEKRAIDCVTWGAANALDQPGSDPDVARRVAHSSGAGHQYYEILPDVRDRESLDDALTQFLLAGEGGNEHFRGYVDRFAVWRRMCHDGIAGLIRGDECFGWDKRFPDASDVGIRRGLGGTMLADLFDERQLDVLELPGQTWPETLRRRADEPEEIYAVRLNHSYRTPVVKSALTDAKAGHVDIVTPFQTRRVIEFVRTLPPELIKGKRLFKAYALRCSRVDIATAPAIRPHYKLFDESIFFELLRDCHERGLTRGVVPEPFVLWTLGRLELPAGAPQKSWRAALKATAKRVLGRNGEGRQSGPPMPLNVFAFRCLLASKVSLMFSQDAEEHRPAELRLPARQVSKESV